VRKYLFFTGKLDFYWGYKFSRGSCFVFLIPLDRKVVGSSVNVTTPAQKKLCTTLGIWGAKSFFFRDLGAKPP